MTKRGPFSLRTQSLGRRIGKSRVWQNPLARYAALAIGAIAPLTSVMIEGV